jgi:hypothetical protein
MTVSDHRMVNSSLSRVVESEVNGPGMVGQTHDS